MEKITLKNTDLQVSNINLGGNVFGWTLNETESFAILDAYAEAGHNFIDTADAYGWWLGKQGISETIIGNWMKSRGNRKEMVIATKVGSQTATNPGPNVSIEYISKTVDESLERLQTDYIDLYYTHFDDGLTPVEETLSAYDIAIKAGKVRYIGASNISPERLEQSFHASDKYNLPRYIALQPHYNLLERYGYESNFAPLAEKYNLSVFPYFALASGFLTGKYRKEQDFKKSVRGEGAAQYFNEHGLTVLHCLDFIHAKNGASQASIALAWLLNRQNIVAPIVSATNQSQLHSILIASELKLDLEDLQWLDRVTL